MKKFILFLVEGKNDTRELKAILHLPCFAEDLRKFEPWFIEANTDLTTASGITADNIQKRITDLLMNFRNKTGPYRGIKVNEIQELIQIVDLDGAFIPPSHIIRDNTGSEFVYTLENIYTSNVDGAIGRNRKKAAILRKLIGVSQIGNVPYSVYFVSRNMEHVLFNQIGVLSKDQKRKYSEQFSSDCDKSSSILNESIFSEEVMSKGPYVESWEIVQTGTHSLSRKTNMNLLFSEEAKNKR